MSNIPYSITPAAISVYVKNRIEVVGSTNPNYKQLREALLKPKHDIALIAKLANIETFFAHITHGRIQIGVDGDERIVRFDGKPVHSTVPKRIFTLLDGGYDIYPLVRFLDKVMTNPTLTARDELFDWLESGNNPITPEGNFLAFKKVRHDYLDIHSATIRNAVGDAPEMDRSLVDPSRYVECAAGLHFCSHGYLSTFSRPTMNYRVMILEVDPADVVAIPNDYHRQKGRTWRYKVIGEIQESKAKTFFEGKPLVSVVPAEPSVLPEAVCDEALLSTFKIGNVVRCTDVLDGDRLTKGNEYVVVYVNQEGDELSVTDDADDEWCFPVMQFVLVNSEFALEDEYEYED